VAAATSVLKDLRDILSDAFTPAEFDMFVRIDIGVHPYHISSIKNPHVVVFDVIDWADRQGRLDELILKAAAALPNRADLQALVQSLGLGAAPSGTPGGQGGGQPAGQAQPSANVPLATAFKDARQAPSPNLLLHDRCAAYRPGEAGRPKAEVLSQILDPDPGVRLEAVLELERNPDLRYVTWLAERVTVEPPFVGLRAAIALRRVADEFVWHGLADLQLMRGVVVNALDRLSHVPDGEGRRLHLASALGAITPRLDEALKEWLGQRKKRVARSDAPGSAYRDFEAWLAAGEEGGA
jgi:hypothetical protein